MAFLITFGVLWLMLGFWPTLAIFVVYAVIDIAFIEHQKREAWRRA